MLNGKEYTSLMQEALWNSARYIGLQNGTNSYLDKLTNSNAIGDNRIGNIMTNITKNTNWLDYIRQDALLSDNSFSMSGGGEKATYRFALGYLSDVGTTIGTSMKQVSILQ